MKRCCRPGQATDDNMAHAHYMLDTESYLHTLRICNIHCFSATHSDCTNAPQCDVTRRLPVLFILISDHYC